jgi:hypothetical protein
VEDQLARFRRGIMQLGDFVLVGRARFELATNGLKIQWATRFAKCQISPAYCLIEIMSRSLGLRNRAR